MKPLQDVAQTRPLINTHRKGVLVSGQNLRNPTLKDPLNPEAHLPLVSRTSALNPAVRTPALLVNHVAQQNEFFPLGQETVRPIVEILGLLLLAQFVL